MGSTSIQSLLGRLASANGFKLVRDTVNQVEMVTMDKKGQEELANRVMAHPEGSVFSKHVAWWVEPPTISLITLLLQKG